MFENNRENRVEELKEAQRKLKYSYEGARRSVFACNICGVSAHVAIPKRKAIHDLFTEGLSCIEIMHSQQGKEIWKSVDKKGNRVTVNHEHPVVKEGWRLLEASLTTTRRRTDGAEEMILVL
jgi:hypothetical protein